ncbi:glycosyltransferase family 2 protein [Egicoccus sp. AB-alg2]|uniref:glycosyltransferase family 2 protein n=1 Tax=Egicoccus sp. AB-alg2 TaxID=3242693 RepID=UPI00359EB8AE
MPTSTPLLSGNTGESEDLVTVVVPARDEEAHIGACLDSVLAQTHHRLQVVVVDGASRDHTADIVAARLAQDERVELVHNPASRIPISLNLALAAARGRWLVRVDAHAVIPREYVSIAVGHLRTGRWGGVGGRKDGVGVTPAGKAIAAAMASPFGVGNSAYHYATEPRTVDHIPFGCYPVELARRLGGWDERLAVNQDFEFDYRIRRAGYELLLDPALTIDWVCRQSIRDLAKQYHRYGRGKTRVARLHPDSLQPRHLAAPTLVISWLLALVLLVRGRPRAAAGLVGPYVVGLLAASAWTARGISEPRVRRHLPGAFIAMHAGWGIGFLSGAVPSLRWRATPWKPAGPLVPAPRPARPPGSRHR